MGSDFYMNPPRDETVSISQMVKNLEEERKALLKVNVKLAEENKKLKAEIKKLKSAIKTFKDVKDES